MAGPLAPEITQAVPPTGDPIAVGTVVANLAQPTAETDPGPFTYEITQDPQSAFTVAGATLEAAIVMDGDYPVSVTATSALGTSPEGSYTISVGGAAWTDAGVDENPQFPPIPPTPAADVPDDAWKTFLVMATTMVVPRARNGVDFVVARPDKFAAPENIYWDDVVLGPRPAEIDDVAKQLAAAWPGYTEQLQRRA